jgi:hypothetical protein
MFNDDNFTKDYNVPGSAGGETNGLYAAVTSNDMVDPDEDYFDDNTPSVFEDIAEFARAIPGAINTVQNARVKQAQTNAAVRKLNAPSLMEQFNGLDFFGKASIIIAVGGFVYLMVKK